jgi:uncharacterized DUF497 family protein
MGLDEGGVLLVIAHRFDSLDADAARIRIISARRATRKETGHYEKGI